MLNQKLINMSIEAFKNIHTELKLSHHPFERSLNYLKWAFKSINFENKSVLDIGGGNGIYSYYSKFCGAESCINLEPFQAGSKNVFIKANNVEDNLKVEIINKTIQEFNSEKKFDVIILHDSINHLDEPIFSKINIDQESFEIYSKLIEKISNLLNENGVILVTDCSRYNFWGMIGVKSPFAPSIEWEIHQSPYLIKKLFKNHGFSNFKIRWSPFKRFGLFGRVLSYFGYIPAFFMQSHFNIKIIRK